MAQVHVVEGATQAHRLVHSECLFLLILIITFHLFPVISFDKLWINFVNDIAHYFILNANETESYPQGAGV